MLPNKKDNPKGLYGKYHIEKVAYDENGNPKGTIDVEEGAEYFIMRLDTGGDDLKHIAACRVGIHAYADTIEAYIPKLAHDLRERYPLLHGYKSYHAPLAILKKIQVLFYSGPASHEEWNAIRREVDILLNQGESPKTCDATED